VGFREWGEHGIFDNLDELYLAREGGVEIIRRRG
jgi:hypothetical protein